MGKHCNIAVRLRKASGVFDVFFRTPQTRQHLHSIYIPLNLYWDTKKTAKTPAVVLCPYGLAMQSCQLLR
jgi:hypothetical protein